MFIAAAGNEGVVADLSAQVASLRRQVKELQGDVEKILTTLAAASDAANASAPAYPAATTPSPMKPKSGGNESGGTK